MVVLGGLILMPRGLLRKAGSPGIADLFWRAESGETISPEEVDRLLQQVSDTDPTNYPPAVALLLIYGRLPEGAPPMVYIQRLRQIETPCARAYLGRLAWHTQQKDKAWSYWREAADCPETSLFLAQAYLKEGHPDSACLILKRPLALSGAAQQYQQQLLRTARCPSP